MSEKRNSFLRPLKQKGFPKKIVTKAGVYDLGISTTLESNKSPGGSAVSLYAVAGLMACKDANLFEAFSCPWPPSQTFYKLL